MKKIRYKYRQILRLLFTYWNRNYISVLRILRCTKSFWIIFAIFQTPIEKFAVWMTKILSILLEISWNRGTKCYIIAFMVTVISGSLKIFDQWILFEFMIKKFSCLIIIHYLLYLGMKQIKLIFSNSVLFIYLLQYHEILGIFFQS